jgi:hypothetical protein
MRKIICDLVSQWSSRCLRVTAFLTILLGFGSLGAWGQFSGNILGTVADPSGAAVPKSTIILKNQSTKAVKNTITDALGNFRFVNLAPSEYTIFVTAESFTKTSVNITLDTNQTLNVPVKLSIATLNSTIEVTTQAPIVDTTETRNQLTLETQAVSELPLAGRNMISLATFAPGVTGLGTSASSTPGSGVDNFSTETQVDASANGQGAVGNMYIVDGLDVTSGIRPGVLNMTPNPDTIQEANIQTNTYNVEYGRGSSMQMTMTTKSGTSQYHGSASDYFTNQSLFAHTEFTDKWPKFHSDNMSGTIGGPIIPGHQAFFFFSIEPLRSITGSSSSVTFEDPQFAAWAEQYYPSTVGTTLLKNYAVKNVTNAVVSETTSNISGCGTSSTNNLPCDLAMIDTGNYADSSFRNGDQWNIRLDKDFKNDHFYGTFFRTTLNTNSPYQRPNTSTASNYEQYALQVNEAHTFSANTINEASFALLRLEGTMDTTGDYEVPYTTVTGIGSNFGISQPELDFIQHGWHWRDVLTHTHHSHILRFGYEGWFGDDVEDFSGWHDHPVFAFNNLLDLVQDNVYTETNVSYSPLTGLHTEWTWNAASFTHGIFAEDTWKARRNLTVNMGVRWDDFGNPYSRSANTVFGNFYYGSGTYGSGSTSENETANGYVVEKNHALNRAITDIFSPRGGFSWDITGNSKWILRGGAGIYHNWPTLANVTEEFRGNPPGSVYPTFYGGSTTEAPIYSFGTSQKKDYGFSYPTLTLPILDSKGGSTSTIFGIGGIDPELKTPVVYTWSATLERPLFSNIVASLGYVGTDGKDLLSGGGQVYNVSYGQDINSYAGDLVANATTTSVTPKRLNTSFGSISYTKNDRVSRYNAMTVDVRGRFAKVAFFDASYTRSVSKDNTQVYPTWVNPHQWYGPSVWDVPHRFSLSWAYDLPSFNGGKGVIGRVAGGWGLSGTTILQSGTPFMVDTTASFSPTFTNGKVTGMATGSGDYNADGDNLDYPNVASYTTSSNRKNYINGIFGTATNGAYANFSVPTMGTEGNEKAYGFRNPGYADTDVSLSKNTKLRGSASLQFRFEFYDVFNRPNLESVTSDLSSSSFGKSTAQYNPRWLQIGANFKF